MACKLHEMLTRALSAHSPPFFLFFFFPSNGEQERKKSKEAAVTGYGNCMVAGWLGHLAEAMLFSPVDVVSKKLALLFFP